MPEQSFLDEIVEDLLREEGLKFSELPAGVRARTLGQHRFFFNYSPEPVTLDLPPGTKFVLGTVGMPVAGVTIVEESVAR